jgi:hypothetical protein
MAKRYYNLEKETKAFLKRMEETRDVLPDSAGIARINDYIVKRKGLNLILSTRNRVAQVFRGGNNQKIQVATNSTLTLKPSYEMVAWIFPRTVSSQRELISKGGLAQTSYEYSLTQSLANFNFRSSNGTTINNTPNKASTLNTWNFFRFGRDQSTGNLFLSRNNDVPVTVAQAAQAPASNYAFCIGDWSDGASQPRPGDCDVDSVGRWDRVLTVDEYTFLYNLGRGVSFYEILGYRPSLLNSLVSYWQLSEGSGIRYDWWGSNHLTPNFTLTTTTGIIDKFF